MQLKKVVLTTNNIAERNSAELIDFYEKHPEKLELVINEQETPDNNIDVEFYGYQDAQSTEFTLLEKIGIPYDKDVNL